MEEVPRVLAGTGVACATTLMPYEHHKLAVEWGASTSTTLDKVSVSFDFCLRIQPSQYWQPAGVRFGYSNAIFPGLAQRNAAEAVGQERRWVFSWMLMRIVPWAYGFARVTDEPQTCAKQLLNNDQHTHQNQITFLSRHCLGYEMLLLTLPQ